MDEEPALPDRTRQTRQTRNHPARAPSVPRPDRPLTTTAARGGITRRAQNREGGRGRIGTPARMSTRSTSPVRRHTDLADHPSDPPLPNAAACHLANIQKIKRLVDPPNDSDFDAGGWPKFYLDPAYNPPEVVEAKNFIREGRVFCLINGEWMRYGKNEAYQETYNPDTRMYTRTNLGELFIDWYSRRARAGAGNALSLSTRRRRMYGFNETEDAGEGRF